MNVNPNNQRNPFTYHATCGQAYWFLEMLKKHPVDCYAFRTFKQ
ncbi:MAG: hypothetical protein Kow0065_24300 [Methylomicrobium sp.]